jgi:hypothetical protein
MKYAVLVLLMNTGTYGSGENFKVEYTTKYFESGYTTEQCMVLAAQVNSAAPMAEGNMTAACMPQINED